MHALLALPFVLPMMGTGTATDFGAGAETRAGGGLIPNQAASASDPAFESSLTLLSGMRIRSRRTQFSLRYQPRLYLLVPNAAGVDRPLLFHQGSSSYQTNLTRRLEFSLSARGGAGELSYNSLQLFFDPGTGALQQAVIPLAVVNGKSALAYRSTPRHTTTFSVGAGVRGPLEEQPETAPDDPARFQTSTNAQVELSHAYDVSKTDQVGLSSEAGFFASDRGEQLVLLGGSAFWSHQLEVSKSLMFTAGAQHSRSLEGGVAGGVVPTGSVTYGSAWHVAGHPWKSAVSFGVRGFFDQAFFVYRSQAFAQWSLDGQLNRAWSTGVDLFASAPLSEEPLTPPRRESFAGVRIPANYELNNHMTFLFGGRFMVRAPHPTAFDQMNSQIEAAGFVGLRYTIATDRTQGDWL